MVRSDDSTELSAKIRRTKTGKTLAKMSNIVAICIEGSCYRLLADELMTTTPTVIDASYIEKQEKLGFWALLGRNKEAQEIRTAVRDDAVSVEHFEN